MPNTLIVLGMYLSGTEAVAEVLTKLSGGSVKNFGATGNEASCSDVVPLELASFHEELLDSAGCAVYDWQRLNLAWYRSPAAVAYKRRARDLFELSCNKASLSLLNDPRICRFVPFWTELLREIEFTPHVVVVIHSPLDVAVALETENDIPITKGLLIWLRHMLDAEAYTRTHARSVLTYDQFFSDWRRAADKISFDTSLAWSRFSDRAGYEIDQFVRSERLKHRPNLADIPLHSEIHDWVSEAYQALLELTYDPLSDSAIRTLDCIRTAFDQSSAIFSPVVFDCERRLADVQSKISAYQGRYDEHKLAADNQEARDKEADFLASLEQLKSDHALLVEEKSRLTDVIASYSAKLSASLEERARLSSELNLRDEALAKENRTRDELKTQLAQSQSDIESLQRENRDLEREGAERDARLRETTDENSNALALLDASRQEADEAKALLAVQNESLQQLAAKLAKAQAERDSHVEELEAAIASAADLKLQLDHLRSNLITLQKENESYASEIGRLEFEKTNALDILACRNDDLNAMLALAEREKAGLISDVKRLTVELRQAEFREKTISAEHDSERESTALKLDVLHSAKNSLKLELHRVREGLFEVERENTAVKKELTRLAADKTSAVSSLTSRCADLDSKLEQTELEKEGLMSDVDRMVQELRSMEAAMKRAHTEDIARVAALSEAETLFEAQTRAVRRRLIDAEAALARARVHKQKPLGGFLSPERWGQSERKIIRSRLFDEEWYLKEYKDVANCRFSPAKHYLEEGYLQGYRPNTHFDTRWYLERYEDVRKSGVNPLLHYISYGWEEGRDPGPDFQTTFYLLSYPDVRSSGLNPLAHYLICGLAEGRLASRRTA